MGERRRLVGLVSWVSLGLGTFLVRAPAARAAACDASQELQFVKALPCDYGIEEAVRSGSLIRSRISPDPVKTRRMPACSYECAPHAFTGVRSGCEALGFRLAGATEVPACPSVEVAGTRGGERFFPTWLPVEDPEGDCARIARSRCLGHYLSHAARVRGRASPEAACCAPREARRSPPAPQDASGGTKSYSYGSEIVGAFSPGLYRVAILDDPAKPPARARFHQGFWYLLAYGGQVPISQLTIHKIRGVAVQRDPGRYRRVASARLMGKDLPAFAATSLREAPSVSVSFAAPSGGEGVVYEIQALSGHSYNRGSGQGAITADGLLAQLQDALDRMVILPALAREPALADSRLPPSGLEPLNFCLPESSAKPGSPASLRDTEGEAFSFNDGEIAGWVSDEVLALHFLDATLTPGEIASGRAPRIESTLRVEEAIPRRVREPGRPVMTPITQLWVSKCAAPSFAEAPLTPSFHYWEPWGEVEVMRLRVPVYRQLTGALLLAYFYDPALAERKPFTYYTFHVTPTWGLTRIAFLQDFLNKTRIRLSPQPLEPRPQTWFFGIPLSGRRKAPRQEGDPPPSQSLPAEGDPLQGDTPQLLR